MGDTFEKVFVGDKRKPPRAKTWNAVLEAAKAHQRGEPSQGGAVPAVPETATEILIQNNGGGAVPQFAVLALKRSLFDPAVSFATFAESRAMTVDGSTGQPFCVTQEPIAAGFYGRATITGLTQCQVNLTNTNHYYAVPTPGDITQLTSRDVSTTVNDNLITGAAVIVWTASNFTTTGTQWALVLLCGIHDIPWTAYLADGKINQLRQFLGAGTKVVQRLGLMEAPTGSPGDNPTQPLSLVNLINTAAIPPITADLAAITSSPEGFPTSYNLANGWLAQLNLAPTVPTTPGGGAVIGAALAPLNFSGAGITYSGVEFIGQNAAYIGYAGTAPSSEATRQFNGNSTYLPIDLAAQAGISTPGTVTALGGYLAFDATTTDGSHGIASTQSVVKGSTTGPGAILPDQGNMHFAQGLYVGGSMLVGVAQGGTGDTTLAPGEVLFGNGTSPVGSAGGLVISGGLPWTEAASGKWINIGFGSH